MRMARKTDNDCRHKNVTHYLHHMSIFCSVIAPFPVISLAWFIIVINLVIIIIAAVLVVVTVAVASLVAVIIIVIVAVLVVASLQLPSIIY